MRVLLLPWFHSKTYQVSRYVNIWHQLGASVDIFNYNTKDVLYPHGHLQLRKRGWGKEPIPYDLIHCFSGGSLVIPQLSSNVSRNYDIIFDSGPMFPSIDQTVRYICNLSGYPFQFPLSTLVTGLWLFPCILRGDNVYSSYKRILTPPSSELNNYDTCRQTLIDDVFTQYYTWLNRQYNSLLLQGENDTYLDKASIFKWADKMDSKVSIYKDSKHLNLFKDQPVRYIREISKFTGLRYVVG